MSVDIHKNVGFQKGKKKLNSFFWLFKWGPLDG